MENLISATVIKDSITKRGKRITTIQAVLPRYILAELNTHRLFTRNSASSRAIPFEKMVKSAMETPFVPMAWQTKHSGMQGTEYLTSGIGDIEDTWLRARDKAVEEATILHQRGVTKQLCNRLLEPFIYHTVLITATEWENFFNQRCPSYQTPVTQLIEPAKSKKDCIDNHSNSINIDKLENFSTIDWLSINKGMGEIHIMDLAEKIWDAINQSVPETLADGAWHIPFMNKETIDKLLEFTPKGSIAPEEDSSLLESMYYSDVQDNMIKVAVARCARISYKSLGDDKEHDYEADIKLHDRLLKDNHMSPFEHIAKAMTDDEYVRHIKTSNVEGVNIINDIWADVYEGIKLTSTEPIYIPESDFGWSRNFNGFIQYREIIEK